MDSVADELDTEPTSSTPDPAESPRAPYLAVLRRHRDAGTLSETEYDTRVTDVADAATYGDLETALGDLDRDELPVPTKRRQRRELDDDAAPVVATTASAEAAEDDVLAADDDDLVDDDPVDDELVAVEDDDDELVAVEDDDDDETAVHDEAVTDDDSSDDDDSDDDRELVTAGAASPRTSSGSSGSVARRSRSDRTPATQGKGQATRSRKEATTTTPERTGPIAFMKESVGELRKVVYPTGLQLRNYFVVVLVFVLFIIGVTSGLDLAFGQLVLQVFGR